LTQASTSGALIEDYVARGVFRAAAVPSDSSGRENFRLVWFRNRNMELEVDARLGRVRLREVLPPIAPRSKLDRDLRAWLRARQAPKLPAHRRLDPEQFRAELRNTAGSIQFSITCATGEIGPAIRKLVQLVNEMYLDFLATPERFDWILEAFDLDPDNPRWP